MRPVWRPPKKSSELETQLHVVKVAAARLKQEATIEKKKWLQAEEREKALNEELVEARCKLSKVEAQVFMMAQARMEQYKKIKDFHNKKVTYGTISYLLDKHKVYRRS